MLLLSRLISAVILAISVILSDDIQDICYVRVCFYVKGGHHALQLGLQELFHPFHSIVMTLRY